MKANKGSAGVDGRTVQDAAEYLRQAWPDIRQRLLDGTYKPEPVRRVGLPKPGGGTREPGIPTVVDRLIQQALLLVLQPLIDPSFSAHSCGFRPGRSAQHAVLAAQAHVQAGCRTVVDVDLEKLFDRVSHDIVMDRLAKRIADKRVLRLIRRYLQAGILMHGVCIERHEGPPQGGPLSPLLANVLLDEVVLAGTARLLREAGAAGQRVENGCGAGVGTQVPRVLLPCGAQAHMHCSVAREANARLRDRRRQPTARQRGRSLVQVVHDLRAYVPGWKAYFRLAPSKQARGELDQWLRHRLRALQLKH